MAGGTTGDTRKSAALLSAKSPKGVFRFAVFVRNSSRDLRRFKSAMQNIGVVLNAVVSWKDEIGLRSQLMFAQHVHNHRGWGDRTFA
jgi:hypothetical protein